MKKTMLALAAAGALTVPLAAQAQAADSSSPGLKLGIFDVSGYADISYNHLSNSALFTSGAPSRVFDIEQSGAAVRQVAVTLASQPKQGWGGLINLTAGKDADVIAPFDTNPSNGKGCNVVTGYNADGSKCSLDRFDVTQAFAQYATGPWTVIAGKYVTLAGAEVINSPTNTNFSRSILFGYAIPFSHTGLRASYAASDALTLTAGVNQGWDDIRDTNSAKTLELGLGWTPSKMVALSAQGYFGKERVGGLVNTGPEGMRSLLDAVATINATDQLSFVLNYDYGSQDNTTGLVPSGASKATWSGVAAYANYQFSDAWRLSFRTEYFDDSDGYRTGVVQKWTENTLTLAWMPMKAIEIRAEVRGDHSNVASFLDRNGVTARSNNNSYGLQFLYKF